MIKGAKYELTRNKGDTQLGWQIIQLVERRKTRSTTCRLENQSTMTVEEYEWACLGDGEPNVIGEDQWVNEVISHYDFVGFAD